MTKAYILPYSEISGVNVPVLFFHGDNDKIVPIRIGRTLYEAASNLKEFVIFPGARHNDTFYVKGKDYFDKLIYFGASCRRNMETRNIGVLG